MSRTPPSPALGSLALLIASLPLGGCLAGAAVEVVAETVEGAVEITGAVVDAAIPDGDDDDEDDD